MSILFPSTGDQTLADFAAQLRRLADDVERLAHGAQPSTSDLAAAPLADWWRFTRRETLALIGVVSGHPSRPDGDPRTMVTSEIFALDLERGWARTLSRFYALGRPVPFRNRRAQ
jgi:hypothetical protein